MGSIKHFVENCFKGAVTHNLQQPKMLQAKLKKLLQKMEPSYTFCNDFNEMFVPLRSVTSLSAFWPAMLPLATTYACGI